ncbi:MAG: DUF6788 family protein [Candidatus Sulfotelmatobacter sp.]
MDNTSPPTALRRLAADLAEPKPMRRGSLSERSIKCSKPGCPCAQDPKARHGPYFSLTRAVEGKTRSRYLTPEQAVLAGQQIEAGQEFRTQLEAYWEGCEDWADRELEGSATAAAREAEKGGFKATSKTKLSRKSRRC